MFKTNKRSYFDQMLNRFWIQIISRLKCSIYFKPSLNIRSSSAYCRLPTRADKMSSKNFCFEVQNHKIFVYFKIASTWTCLNVKKTIWEIPDSIPTIFEFFVWNSCESCASSLEFTNDDSNRCWYWSFNPWWKGRYKSL